jgi:hypothetical protein
MRNTVSIIAAAALAATLAGCASGSGASGPPPLLDAHTHMMIENITPDAEIDLLKQAGIARVVLIHYDPEVIAALAKTYPGYVIPALGVARPQVKGVHLDADTGPLMAKLYTEHAICAFGEITGGFADNANFDAIYAAAASTWPSPRR